MVDNFCKDTGDYNGLSAVDRLVIALGVSISREKNEFDKVVKEPKPLNEFRPKNFKPFYDKDQQNSSSDEEDTQTSKTVQNDGFDDEFTVTAGGGRRGLKDRDIKKVLKKQENKDTKIVTNVSPEEEQKAEEPEATTSDEDKFDDEEEGGEWVTTDNLFKHISGGTSTNLMENQDNLLFTQGAEAKEPEQTEDDKTEEPVTKEGETEDEPVKKQEKPAVIDHATINYVKFITSDFAMQNVII